MHPEQASRTAVPALVRVSWALRRPGADVLLPAFAVVLGFGAVGYGGFAPLRVLAMGGALGLVWLVAGRGSRLPRGISLGLGALGAGILVVAATHPWSIEPLFPLATLATAAGSLVVVRGAIARGERASILRALAWAGAAVAAAGLVGLALHADRLAGLATGVWRVSSTLGYANAAGAFLALTLPAALLLAFRHRRPVDRGLVFVVSAGLALTASRGALLASLLAAAVSIALGAGPVIRAAIRPLIGAAIAVAGALPTVTGEMAGPWPMALGMALGAVVAVAPAPGRWAGPGSAPRRALVAGCLVALPALAVVAWGAAGDPLERLAASRLDVVGEGRLGNWAARLDAALDRPVVGHGFETHLPTQANRFAHNEYLQVFHDGGVVGLAAVILALAAFARTAAASPGRAEERSTWAIAVAACGVFVVHSGVDFLWRYPVVVLLAFTWLAVAVTRPEEKGAGR